MVRPTRLGKAAARAMIYARTKLVWCHLQLPDDDVVFEP